MKSKLIFAAAAVVGSLVGAEVTHDVRKIFGSDRVVTIHESEFNLPLQDVAFAHEFDRLGRDPDLDVHHFKVPAEAVEKLKALNIPFDDRTEDFFQLSERNLQASSVCLGESCFSLPQDEFHSTWQVYESIMNRFEKVIHDPNSDRTSWDLVGLSHYGNESRALVIGDDGQKPVVYYYCAVHAREWIVPMFCTYMAERLLDGSAESEDLLQKLTFVIIPIVNPDGYIYSHKVDPNWRKTLKPNPGSSCFGVDANRNWDYCFGGPGSSGNACSYTYRGQSAFDQPCTLNLKNFAEKFDGRIIHVGDVHAKGSYLLAPWSFTDKVPAPNEKAKNEICSAEFQQALFNVHGMRFTTGPGAVTLYPAAGVTPDYFYGVKKVVHSYTYEARSGGISGWQPDVSNIIKSNEEMYAGMVALTQCIYRTEITDPLPSGPLPGDASEFRECKRRVEDGREGCVDREVTGIRLNGVAATCEQLESQCSEYYIVRDACPRTCNSCVDVGETQQEESRQDRGRNPTIKVNVEVTKDNESTFILMLFVAFAAFGGIGYYMNKKSSN